MIVQGRVHLRHCLGEKLLFSIDDFIGLSIFQNQSLGKFIFSIDEFGGYSTTLKRYCGTCIYIDDFTAGYCNLLRESV